MLICLPHHVSLTEGPKQHHRRSKKSAAAAVAAGWIFFMSDDQPTPERPMANAPVRLSFMSVSCMPSAGEQGSRIIPIVARLDVCESVIMMYDSWINSFAARIPSGGRGGVGTIIDPFLIIAN
ncbi:hypothetical protein ABZX51_001539 [Aspergillus tubingensis]